MCLKKVNKSGVIFLMLYVDDILLLGKKFIFTLPNKIFACPRFIYKENRSKNLYIGYKDL